MLKKLTMALFVVCGACAMDREMDELAQAKAECCLGAAFGWGALFCSTTGINVGNTPRYLAGVAGAFLVSGAKHMFSTNANSESAPVREKME